MRFDTPVYFQRITPGEYDVATGNYAEDIITEDKRYASVTSAGVQTLRIVYGELKQGCLVIRLQMPYPLPFDRIRVGEKVYSVDMARPLRNKHSFVVSEVQQSGENQS